MGEFSFRWGGAQRPLSVSRDRSGNWFYKMFSSGASYNSLTTEREKLNIILKNPAVLKVFKLNCDLATLGKVNSYNNDVLKEINALSKLQPKPNKHQTWKQFMWDYMFYSMIGTAYMWRSNNTNMTASTTSFYWLNPAKLTWINSLDIKLDKLDLSDVAVNELGKQVINYQFRDGKSRDIPLKEIQPFFDLSNSVSENWYKGNSAIDALYKVISNADIALDANNINLDFSKKFFITGEQNQQDIYNTPMGETEKKSIEEQISSEKEVHATKTHIEIKRFVDDLKKLGFDETYLWQVFIIGSMYGIPKDVLDANLKGSTYENQEKSTGKHISYSIQPKMDDLMEWFSGFLSVELKISYDHLPFMQIFEMDRATTTKLKADTFKTFVDAGIEVKEAMKLSGLAI